MADPCFKERVCHIDSRQHTDCQKVTNLGDVRPTEESPLRMITTPLHLLQREAGGAPGLHLAVVVVDETAFEAVGFVQESLRFIQTDYHAPGRIGVCQKGIRGHYCRTQEAVLDRISCARIDRVGIFLSVTNIELTVVS